MSRRIITISREFGSGGRAIGEAVAKQLGVTFYDKNFIAEIAEKSGLSKEFIEKKGEYSPLKNIFSYAFVGRDSSGNSLDDYLYSIQRDTILDLADKESCVIVGRCADFILKGRTDCMNVFIHGEEHEKLLRIQSLYHKSEAEAKKLMHETDKKRSVHYKYYTEQEWGRAANYTVSLNSSQLGYETCIETIISLAK